MKNENRQIKKGILFAILTSIISGIAIFYSKIAVVKISPLILTTSRNLYVGVIFLLFFLISQKFSEIKKLKRKELIFLLIIGVLGGALPFYLFFSGLQLVKAPVANLIHKTLFIWVAVLAIAFLKEKFNFKYFLSYFLIVIGSFYIAPLPYIALGKGEGMILTATVLWALENILAKKVLKKVSSEIVGLFRMGAGSIFLLSAVFLSGQASLFLDFDIKKLSIILIGGTILFFYVYFWYKALKYAPASLVTLILTFSVVVSAFLNGVFVGVKASQRDIFSWLLITLGIFLLYLKNWLVLPGKKNNG